MLSFIILRWVGWTLETLSWMDYFKQDVEEVLPCSALTGYMDGSLRLRPKPVSLVGDHIDCSEGRLRPFDLEGWGQEGG